MRFLSPPPRPFCWAGHGWRLAMRRVFLSWLHREKTCRLCLHPRVSDSNVDLGSPVSFSDCLEYSPLSQSPVSSSSLFAFSSPAASARFFSSRPHKWHESSRPSSSSSSRSSSSAPSSSFPASSPTRPDEAGGREEMEKLRTFGIFAHIDAGKTTTTEAFLLEAGQIARKGSIDDGTTTMDFMAQERERGITIQSAATCFPWREEFFQLIDTPGHVDFSAEVQLALCAVDGACVLLDASRGVEAQTRAIWKALTTHSQTAKIIFVNKMDRDGVDMDACLEAVRQRLNAWPLQVNAVYQVPRAVWSNSNSREKRKTHSVAPQAIIDLTDFCTALYPPVSSFLDASSLPVFYSPPPHVLASLLSSAPSSSPSSSPSVFPSSPPSSPTWAWWNDPRISADVKNRRERLVEDLSLLDDAFEQCVAAGTASCMQSAACGSLPDPRDAQAQRGERGERGETEATASELLAFRDEMRAALRRTALQNLAVPVLFGSSFFSRGVTQLLDGISAFLPSPLDRPPLPLVASTRKAPTPPSRPSCFSSCGRFLSPDRQAAAACVAFKVYPDGKGGRIAFVRVLAGRITPRTSLFNSTKNCLESSSSLLQLFRVKADAYHSVAALSSGDIGAIRGLSAVTAGDVLHLASAPSFVLPLLSPFHRPSLCSSTNAASPLFPPPETPGHTSAASPFSPSAPFSPPFSVRSSAPFSSALHSLSPVCFTSVACRNAREETEMAEALAAASLSDVALKFEKDEAGKFVLWGLGELHLQVIQARLRDEFGLSVEFGPLEVAYRELLLHPVRGSLTYSPSSSSAFDIAFSLLPLPLTPPEQRLSALLSSREDPGFVALCRAAEEVEAIPFPSLSSSLTHQTHLLFSLSPEAADQLQTLEDAQKNARRAKCPGKTPRIASLSSSTHSAPSPSSSLLSESVLLRAIQEAAYHASGAGPLLSYPLDFLHIRLESVAVRDGSAQLSPSSLSAASAQLLRLLLRTGRGQSLRQAQGEETESFQDASGDPEALRDRVAMLEPVMHMEICSPSQSLGPLMRDLTQQRRASIVSIAAAGKESATGEESHEDAKDWRQFQISGEEDSAMMELHAVVPLRCMESYSSVLRALSHGQAHFQMRPLGYGRVSALDEETLLAEAGMVPSSF